jgi:serine/threonine protein kinase
MWRRWKIVVINKRRYFKIGVLGKGAYAEVFEVATLDDGKKEHYALKIGHVSDDIAVLGCVTGPNIVKIIYGDGENGLLLMQLGGRSLKDFFLEKGFENKSVSGEVCSRNWSLIQQVFLGMLEALTQIHDAGWVHCDFKPGNIFFDGKTLLLGDLGSALPLLAEHREQINLVVEDSVAGTPDYMPPEAYADPVFPGEIKTTIKDVSAKFDVWALGCVLYVLLFGRPPFGHLADTKTTAKKTAAIVSRTTDIEYPVNSTVFEYAPVNSNVFLPKNPEASHRDEPSFNAAVAAVKLCLAKNFDLRATVEELKDCEFATLKL